MNGENKTHYLAAGETNVGENRPVVPLETRTRITEKRTRISKETQDQISDVHEHEGEWNTKKERECLRNTRVATTMFMHDKYCL